MSRFGRITAAVATKRRLAGGRAREQALGLAASLRNGSRGESRRRRLLWVAVAGLLVIGPLAFNLAREPGFTASVELFPRAVKPYPAITNPEYYRRLLADPELRLQMRFSVGDGLARYEDVTIERLPGRLRLDVEADSPEDAARFVNALAPQIAGATQRQLAVQMAEDLAETRARATAASPGEWRRFLRGRVRRLSSFGEFPPTRVLPGAAAEPPRLERWADRLVEDLPGEFRARPSPFWSALAGLLVAATLWAICLVLFPPKRH